MTLDIAAVTFDSHDAAALAGFWSALLETEVDPGATEDLATVGREAAGGTLMFMKVPDKNLGKNTVHLDLFAADLSAEVDRAIGLGAKRMGDFDEAGFVWTTLADPEGNLFDIARH